jgi:hypothetical protein
VLAVTLDFLQMLQRFEIAVGEAGFVAREFRQGVAVAGVPFGRRPDEDQIGLGVVFGQVLGEMAVVANGFVKLRGEERGLEAGDAAHTPFGVGELAQQVPLQRGLGLELVF